MIVSLSSLVSVLNNAMLLKSGYKLEQIFIVKSFHRSSAAVRIGKMTPRRGFLLFVLGILLNLRHGK